MKNFKILLLGMVLGLGLCGNTKAQIFRYSNKYQKGAIILVAGVTFITTSVIQNNAQGYYTNIYSPYYNTFNNVYVTPNILNNTPNNIMLGVGITLSVTGIVYCLRTIR
jgi:hypothetical protein